MTTSTLLPAGARPAWLPALPAPGLLLAAFYLALLLLALIAPQWLASGDPLAASARDAFRAPGAGHWLGTDENGRDVWTRLVYGARPSLLLGLAASSIALGAGITLGLLAGLSRRGLERLLMRGVDVLQAFPELLLALIIITFFGAGWLNATVAIGVAGIPRYARMVRVQTALVRRAPYVEAARTLGLSDAAVVWRHVLPNAIEPILPLAMIGVGATIAAGAAISFIGLGTPPPAAEWGAMLAMGRNFMGTAWWLVALPALAISLSVLALTALGRAWLRRREGVTR